MTNFKKSVTLVLLALGSNTYASSELIYVPELTGLYNIGDVADLKEINVAFAYSGSDPRFLTYELSGYIKLPVLNDPTAVSGQNSDINFNGGVSTSNTGTGPGISWGTTLNQNQAFDWNGMAGYQTFDPSTGAFYFGSIFNSSVSNPSAYIYAVFYNYNMDFTNQYASRGNVFVESARVGLSSSFLAAPSSNPPMNVIIQAPDYMINAVPVPGAVWLFGSSLIGLLSFNRRKNKTANVIAA